MSELQKGKELKAAPPQSNPLRQLYGRKLARRCSRAALALGQGRWKLCPAD